MLEQQKSLSPENRGYWGYRELTEEELKHVGGSGCGCGCGCGGGGGGGDSDSDASDPGTATDIPGDGSVPPDPTAPQP
jgi:hypothetical protein